MTKYIITEEIANREYQERSDAVNDRGTILSIMLVSFMVGPLFSGNVFDFTLLPGVLGMLYMLLSMLQAFWQTVTVSLFKWYMVRTKKTYTNYPSFIRRGAWVMFVLKNIVLVVAVVYLVLLIV